MPPKTQNYNKVGGPVATHQVETHGCSAEERDGWARSNIWSIVYSGCKLAGGAGAAWILWYLSQMTAWGRADMLKLIGM